MAALARLCSWIVAGQTMAFHRMSDKAEEVLRQMTEEDGLEMDLDVYNNVINV